MPVEVVEIELVDDGEEEVEQGSLQGSWDVNEEGDDEAVEPLWILYGITPRIGALVVDWSEKLYVTDVNFGFGFTYWGAMKVESIPHICHVRADGVRVNFFWPVWIFTDLTQKIGIFDRFYAKKWRFLQI